MKIDAKLSISEQSHMSSHRRTDIMGSDAGAPAVAAPRVYKTWKGNNVFCLEGRFIFGSNVIPLLWTIVLIIAPVAIFCIFVARKLTDDFSKHLGVSAFAIVVALTLCVIVFLLLTAGSDPGIVPRDLCPPESNGYDNTEVGNVQTSQIGLPRVRDVVVNGIIVQVKYCKTCLLYRPPRCSHCSVCNNCVERFDHHCPATGQCIGLVRALVLLKNCLKALLESAYAILRKIMEDSTQSIVLHSLHYIWPTMAFRRPGLFTWCAFCVDGLL